MTVSECPLGFDRQVRSGRSGTRGSAGVDLLPGVAYLVVHTCDPTRGALPSCSWRVRTNWSGTWMLSSALLDDPIRPQQQRLRDCQPERLRGLEVDDQFEPVNLLEGKVPRLGTLEDLVD